NQEKEETKIQKGSEKEETYTKEFTALQVFRYSETNLKYVSKDCGGTRKGPGTVERGSQPVEDLNELDHTNPTREGRETFAEPVTGLPSASDTTTMGDALTSTAATTKWAPTEEPIRTQK
ncbi:hypothetical protein A2U01_0018580, partial [Trifolium medium]|nr:hypothetical protein [Trifolium medium]